MFLYLKFIFDIGRMLVTLKHINISIRNMDSQSQMHVHVKIPLCPENRKYIP